MKLPGPLRSLTAWSLAALAAGFGLGLAGNAVGGPVPAALAAILRPVGALWLAALQMTVLPLVMAVVLAAIVGTRGAAVGRLTARAFLVFAAMLAAAMAVTVVLAPLLIGGFGVGPDVAAALQAATPVSPGARTAAGADAISPGDLIARLLPTNLFAAAVNGEILPLLLFAALLGLAVNRLPDAQRQPLARAAQGLASAMLTIVQWILWFLPLGVFALVFLFTREVGTTMIGFVGTYVAMMCILAVVVTLLLYPASVLVGRVSLGRFARGAAPGQLVAMSTRSSMASLPALVQGGREHLRLPPPVAGMALPLSVSVLRMSAVISAPFNLIYLAYVFGIPLSGVTLVSSLIAIFLLSFSTPGIPGAGPTVTLPVYIAAGIPIEGIVMLEAAEVVPDIFKTVLNVTGHMSAATILARSSRREPGVAPEAEPVTA